MIGSGLFSKDPMLAPVLVSALGREYTITPVTCCSRAQALAGTGECSLWIVDADSTCDPGREWHRFVCETLGGGTSTPVIMMTTDEDRADVLKFANENGHDCVRKPPAVRELKLRLQKAWEAWNLKRDLEGARRFAGSGGLDQLTGSSAPMLEVYSLIRRVAKLEASVLITGESGTGKELVARAIHNLGHRARRPFVALSCGAIPETLIEAELFGHEKGAFTGTAGTREGYLEKASDGTLFFDEIGELSAGTQVKLLRVLQEREFYRLGSTRPVPLRARIIFATHRDLGSMVASGTFRQDLYYRINVLNLTVPALRDHAEDIPVLVHHFLRRYSETYGKPIDGIEADAMQMLCSYTWPGNVRELENVVQRAIVMCEDDIVRSGDLLPALQDLDMPQPEERGLPEGSFERLVQDYKVKLVKDAVAQCNGNKSLAAQTLSISRAYLHRLIRIPAPVLLETERSSAMANDFPYAASNSL